MESQQITSLQEQLVREIERYVRNETILHAFRMVPRHLFISTFFNRSFEDYKPVWSRIDPTDSQWIEEIYKNRPLTVSIDQKGDPNVSSSQPDIMANMIQSARLRFGHRVLEIGTGTGYNAALLATIVGNEQVVSIDINAALLGHARDCIEAVVGFGVTLLHADGRNLPESLGVFDSIIITGSHDRIEPSWIRALTPGGRIILNWITSLTKVFIEAEKVESGLVGHVARYGGDFMHLHEGKGVQRSLLPYKTLPRVSPLNFLPQLLEDLDFGFFLQVNLPSLTLHRYRKKSSGEVSYSVEDDKNRVVHFSSLQISGDVSLWEEIDATYKEFVLLNKPSKQEFSFRFDEKGHTFIYGGFCYPHDHVG